MRLNRKIRKDWIEIQYKELVNKVSTNNKKLKQKEYHQKGDFPVIDQGQELIGGYTNDEARLLDCELPALVFGDHTKVVKLINFRFAPGADGTKVLEPKKFVLPKFLSYLTQILVFKIKDKGYARHYQHIEKQSFPIAPLPEQRAIVAKIDQLFSELDNGIANLQAAKDKLEVYRQAVLKKAFEGKLTNEWRERQRNLPTADELLEQIDEERQKYYENQLKEWEKEVAKWEANTKQGKKPKKTKKPINVNPVKLNSEHGQIHIKIEDTSYNIVDCLHSTPQFQSCGKYCVDTTCIVNGQIIWDKVRYVSEESFNHRISRLKPEKGDILFAREGTVGTTLVLDQEVDICLGQRMMMFRPLNMINSKYFMYYFQSNEFRKQYEPLIGGTTSPHLNITDIKKLIFPVLSTREQNQIIKEIESRLSVCDNVLANIEEGMEKAEALRQSILKKAFEGKLLSEEELEACRQEPDWEPAEKLVERVNKEKIKDKSSS